MISWEWLMVAFWVGTAAGGVLGWALGENFATRALTEAWDRAKSGDKPE